MTAPIDVDLRKDQIYVCVGIHTEGFSVDESEYDGVSAGFRVGRLEGLTQCLLISHMYIYSKFTHHIRL